MENENKKKELILAVEQIKAGYVELAKNEAVMQDLREFCAMSVPTEMCGKTPNLDVNKVLVATGRGLVLERIDYFINTPVELIVKRYMGA